MPQPDGDPTVEEYGVTWVGIAPKHWEIRRIKTLFRERDERNGGQEGTLLSLTRSRGLVPQASASTRIARAEDLSSYKVCRPGDLVMNRMQAWSGMFAVASERGLVSPDYAVFETITSIQPRYFELLFRTPSMVAEFARRSKGIGTGFNRLYTPDFGAIHIAVPPLDEQVLIVRYLNSAISLLRRYVRSMEELIGPGTQTRAGLLAEFRVRLIADAVTGRLDVREAEALLVEVADQQGPLDEPYASTYPTDGITDERDAVPTEPGA